MMNKKITGSYNDIGVEFDELFDDIEKIIKLEALSLNDVLKPLKVKTILDCACGTGIQSIGLAQHGYTVSASDISKKMVEETKRKARKQGLTIEVKQADFTNLLPWKGRMFDAVINCGHSILYVHSLDEVIQTLHAMQTVTKTGGVIAVEVHNYSRLKREGKNFEFRKSQVINSVPQWIYDARVFNKNKVTVIHAFTKFINGRLYTKSYPKTSLLISSADLKHCMEKSGLASVKLLDLVTLKPFKNEEWLLAIGIKK